MNREKIEKLASVRSNPCVSIIMNTHRTHPDNARDPILLKNLCKEAETRLLQEYDSKRIQPLIENLKRVQSEMEVQYNLDSLLIYISGDIRETVKSPWPVVKNFVQISDAFAVRPLIRDFNRTEPYMILLVTQSGSRLYSAVNDAVTGEIENEHFPFPPTPHFDDEPHKLSDSKRADDLVREYLNKVDKAVVKMHRQNGLSCIVIATEDNFSRLMQVADVPRVYTGFSAVNYNRVAPHHLAADAWAIVREQQRQRRSDAIREMLNAVGIGKVYTDLQSIYRLAKEGRGDLLMVHEDFFQPVRMTGEWTFDPVSDPSAPGVVDDAVSDIAREVFLKKGRVFFTYQDELKSLGTITLKARY